jgi:rfaE bifunctional protein nucleotidyltransferase chain/domain
LTRHKDPQSKILSPENAVIWRESLRKENRKLVLTNGCFDILHRGHAEYLYKSSLLGDALLIAINSDNSVKQLKGPERPLVKEIDRAYVLSCLSYIDAVVIFKDVRCTELIQKLKPDIYAKGGDYNIDSINSEEKKILLECGTDIKFIDLVPGFSTTDFLSRIK